MISVAIALYNSTRYIIEQLDSIREQSVQVDEVVMIDDCSSDETVKIVEEYISHYKLTGWHVEKHIDNKGYITTFYDAIEKCSGDIIILCDHDDIWLPNKVEIIKEQFQNNINILMLATSFLQIDAEGAIVHIKQKRKHANNNLIRRALSRSSLNYMNIYDVAAYNISPGCTCAIRSNLKFMDPNRQNDMPHDWRMCILAACNNGLYYLDIPTTKYRIYEKNTIGLGHVSDFEKRVKVVTNNLKEHISAMELVKEKKGYDSKEYYYYKRITEIFRLRVAYLTTGKINEFVIAFIKSFDSSKLYESVVMDFIVKVKEKVSAYV